MRAVRYSAPLIDRGNLAEVILMGPFKVYVVIREARSPGVELEDVFPTKELAELFVETSDYSEELRIVERHLDKPFFTESRALPERFTSDWPAGNRNPSVPAHTSGR